jgi:transposase InsO family protein
MCAENAIGHQLTKLYTPKTRGMIERFNERISEVIKNSRFQSAQELEETLLRYARVYNHQIPQKPSATSVRFRP